MVVCQAKLSTFITKLAWKIQPRWALNTLFDGTINGSFVLLEGTCNREGNSCERTSNKAIHLREAVGSCGVYIM